MLPALFCFCNLLLEVCGDTMETQAEGDQEAGRPEDGLSGSGDAMETQAEGDQEAGQPEDGLSGRKPYGTKGTFAGHRQPKKEPWASQFRLMVSEFHSIKDHFAGSYSDQGAFMAFYKDGLQAGQDMGNAGQMFLAKIHELEKSETRETEELEESAMAPESEQL